MCNQVSLWFPQRHILNQHTSISFKRIMESGNLILCWKVKKFCQIYFDLTRKAKSCRNECYLYFYLLYFQPTDTESCADQHPPTSQPATNARRNCVWACVCVCFILSLSCANTIIFHTEGKKNGNFCPSTRLGSVWDPYFLTSHIPSVVPLEYALEMLWSYTIVPLVQAPLRSYATESTTAVGFFKSVILMRNAGIRLHTCLSIKRTILLINRLLHL